MPRRVQIELLKEDLTPRNENNDLFLVKAGHPLSFVFNPATRKAAFVLGNGLHDELTRSAETLTGLIHSEDMRRTFDYPSATIHENGNGLLITGFYDPNVGKLSLRRIKSTSSEKDNAGLALIVQALEAHGHNVGECEIFENDDSTHWRDFKDLRKMSHSKILKLFK